MYSVNRYVSSGQKANEITHVNFNRSFAGMKYQINGSGRDTYIYNDQGGFGTMYLPSRQTRNG